VFLVYSEEEFALCPKCGCILKFHRRKHRFLKDNAGKKHTYSIRIMKCNNKACPTKYHRELPDIIIPYKRFDAESIEEAIDQDKSSVKVVTDESTIRRWRVWFNSIEVYIMMALLSMTVVIEDNAKSSPLEIEKQNSSNPLATIKRIVQREVKWLNDVVRLLVNSSKWVVNRSAFLSG
jgi:hypothetical protein